MLSSIYLDTDVGVSKTKVGHVTKDYILLNISLFCKLFSLIFIISCLPNEIFHIIGLTSLGDVKSLVERGMGILIWSWAVLASWTSSWSWAQGLYLVNFKIFLHNCMNRKYFMWVAKNPYLGKHWVIIIDPKILFLNLFGVRRIFHHISVVLGPKRGETNIQAL